MSKGVIFSLINQSIICLIIVDYPRGAPSTKKTSLIKRNKGRNIATSFLPGMTLFRIERVAYIACNGVARRMKSVQRAIVHVRPLQRIITHSLTPAPRAHGRSRHIAAAEAVVAMAGAAGADVRRRLK